MRKDGTGRVEMNRYARFLLVVFSCCAPAISIGGTNDIRDANNQVGVQVISTHVDYTETGDGTMGTKTGVLDTERGRVPGFALFASGMWGPDNAYMQGQVSRTSGHTHYVGAPITGGAYGSALGTSSAKLWDGSVRFGTGLGVHDSTMAIFYLELGVHEWYRGVNYGETYKHAYGGLGLLGQVSPLSGLVLSANALIGKTYRPHISVAGPYGFSSDLGGSNIYKAGLAVDYALARHFHLNAAIDYTHFRYGMGNIVATNLGGGTTLYQWEPDSLTKYVTGRVGVAYSF